MRAVLVVLLLLLGASSSGAGECGVGTFVVTDFEDPEDETCLLRAGLGVRRIRDASRPGGHVLRVIAREEADSSVVEFPRVPRDIRDYETLTFRARSLLDPPTELEVSFVDVAGRRLRWPVTLEDAGWIDVHVALARMHPFTGFNPTAVTRVCFRGHTAFDLDDIRLGTGSGNWRMEGATLIKAFGEGGMEKVVHVRTRHIDLYTDSAAARSSFLRRIEEAHDVILDVLHVQEMPWRLPIYVFRTQGGYWDFCDRYAGIPYRIARWTGGHAGTQYFATWYEAPRAPVFAHELAHCVFHRTVGPGGGSWLQEGVAVYVQHLVEGRSAARIFAPRLRSGTHVPLAEFVTLPHLAYRVSRVRERERITHGHVLYAQAGSLVEFLMRGPLLVGEGGHRTLGLPPGIAALARGRSNPSVETIETHLGYSIQVLEEAWRRWERRPPGPSR